LNFKNFFVNFGCLSIIIYFVYIRCHFLSWLILLSSFLIFYYYWCNASLFFVHDTQLFQILFCYRENEMQNLGYHFCQIFENVMPILKPIVSFTSINLCIFYNYCRNPSLGFMTKARVYKGAGQEWSPGVTFHAPGSVRECEGMNPHTPKWVPTLGVRIPMDFRIFWGRL
jgi:hypothetical protein